MNALKMLMMAVPGTPGEDYTIFAEVPENNFDCQQQQYPGYYANVELGCQVRYLNAFKNKRNFIDILCFFIFRFIIFASLAVESMTFSARMGRFSTSKFSCVIGGTT